LPKPFEHTNPELAELGQRDIARSHSGARLRADGLQ
jgi:hypothetical protein